jgi:hypothetical protein
MRSLKFFALTVSAIILASCDVCGDLECKTDLYDGQFRIVSKATGQDLVFGPTRIYDKNQIRFYALNGTDTIRFDYSPIPFAASTYDSILHVYFFPKMDTAFMKLSNGDVDTFHITYNTYETQCCGTLTEIANFRFNNSVNIPGSKGTQQIRK